MRTNSLIGLRFKWNSAQIDSYLFGRKIREKGHFKNIEGIAIESTLNSRRIRLSVDKVFGYQTLG